MNGTEEEIRKRRIVGALSILCIVSGGILSVRSSATGLSAALLRVGLLLVAFWLAMPSKSRPAAWSGFTSTKLLVIAGIIAASLPSLRPLLPVLGMVLTIVYFFRPRSHS